MEAVLVFLEGCPWVVALTVVCAAAALEYLLPPLPADSVVLASALLVVAGTVSFAAVYTSAVLGGTFGAWAHYQLGLHLADDQGQIRASVRLQRWIGARSMPRFLAAFRAHGLWVVALNRAFPGVRAVTFLAAGAARLPLVPVMLAGLVSNLGWTLLILGVGVRVGRSWMNIQQTFLVYQRAIFLVGGAVLLLFVTVKLWQRQRRA